jgi:hypothetical protein
MSLVAERENWQCCEGDGIQGATSAPFRAGG